MDTIKIGALLKELRKEYGMTQEQLAEKMGVTNRTVSRWETGSNMPDLDILIDLSEFYRIEVRDLLNGERKKAEVSKKENKEEREIVHQLAEYSSRKETHLMQKICTVVAAGVVALGLLFYTTLKAFDNVTGGSHVILLFSVTFMIYNIVMQTFRDCRSSTGYQFALISGFLATILSNLIVLLLFFSSGSYHNYGMLGLLYAIAIVISVFTLSGIITIVLIRKRHKQI